jgi:hypothetical protein
VEEPLEEVVEVLHADQQLAAVAAAVEVENEMYFRI